MIKKKYSELLEKLYKLPTRSLPTDNLNNIVKLQSLLGFPDRKYKCIHVAGTNGKGSVSTKIAAALEYSGYRVGLFTSPHISSYRERIRINGELISQEDIVKILSSLFDLVEKENIQTTLFEMSTLMAMIYFEKANVDFAVFEAGIGGRLDATNVINPIMTVITSISLDHTEMLGNNVNAIAREKAGIIKPRIPIIIGPNVPLGIIKNIALKNEAPFTQVVNKYPVFEEENRAIAQKVLEELNVDSISIEKGLNRTPSCRCEWHYRECPIVFDVGHNPDGLIHLFKAIRVKYPNRSLRIAFGISKSKDIDTCLNVIAKEGEDFHLVEIQMERGASVPMLKEKLLKQGIKESSIQSDDNIFHIINEAIQKKQIVVVCGSFYIMAKMRQDIGIEDIRD